MNQKSNPAQKDDVQPLPDVFITQKPSLIVGVRIRPLKPIVDERGRLMEIFRSDWPEFTKYGQTYMTTAYPGVVKAWHYHRQQVDHFACVHGTIKIVLYDARRNSKTYRVINELFLGDHNPILVEVPPLVYHGFKCISEETSIIVNVTNQVYDYKNPDEFRLPAHTKKISYRWERKDG